MNQNVKPQKSSGYYTKTVIVTVIFIVISLLMIVDQSFSGYDNFMEEFSFFVLGPVFIIGAGLCGFEYGIAMLIPFYLMPLFQHGDLGEGPLLTIPYFLILVLVSGDILKKMYHKISYMLAAVFIIVPLNIVYLLIMGIDDDIFIGAAFLELVAIIILYLYFRFVPDNVKGVFGLGIYYTKDYEAKINNAEPIYSDVQKEINFTETNTSSWKCSQCNNINPNHLTTCTCGKRKDENYKEAVSSKQNTYDLSGLNPKTKQCPNCGTWYGEDHQFCFSCGSKLTDTRTGSNDYVQNIPETKAKLCPNCGTQYDEAHQFCHSCGAKLVATAGNDTAYDNSRVSSGFNPPPNSKQCPRCRLLFNNDKEKCPVCGSELVTRD